MICAVSQAQSIKIANCLTVSE